MPPELLHHIFKFLPLTEVGQLALASEAFRVKVTNWIWTSKCQNRATFEFTKLFTDRYDVLAIPGTPLAKKVTLKTFNPNSEDTLHPRLFLGNATSLDLVITVTKELNCEINKRYNNFLENIFFKNRN